LLLGKAIENFNPRKKRKMEETLSGLIGLYAKLRAEKDSVNQILKDLNEKIEAIELKVINSLQEQKLQSLKGEFGLVSLVNKESFRIPRGEDELKFRQWCFDTGAFDAIYSPQSQKLNAYLKMEWNNALESGNVDWTPPPGVAEPERFYTLSLRKR
jgi:hypothetical protein